VSQCSSSDTPVHLRAIAITRNHTAKHYPLIFLSEISAKPENPAKIRAKGNGF